MPSFRHFALCALLTIASASINRAEAATDASLGLVASLEGGDAAVDAHRDGLADVAARRLASLQVPADAAAGVAEAVRHLLIENLVRSNQSPEALLLLQPDELPFWRALALAQSGSAEAIPLLEDCASDTTSPHRRYAALTLAALQTADGDSDNAADLLVEQALAGDETDPLLALAAAELLLEQGKARTALEPLSKVGATTPRFQSVAALLKAEAKLKLGNAKDAVASLENLLGSSLPLPNIVRFRATLALAEAHSALGNDLQANAVLKQSAESSSDPQAILLTLDRLYESGAFDNPDSLRLLTGWVESRNTALAATSSYFLAQIAIGENRLSEAEAILTRLAANDSAVGSRAKLALIQLYIAGDDPQKAAAAIAKLKASTNNLSELARIQFVQARAQYAEGDFRSAAENFITTDADAIPSDEATFNAALAALRAGDEAEFDTRLALLPEVKGDRLRADLMLERALLLAAQADAKARENAQRDAASDAKANEALSTFARDTPKHKRVAEAYLALASLELVKFPPRPKTVRDALAAAREAELTEPLREQADYLAFWVEESLGDKDSAVKLAKAYLAAWPESKRAPEIQLRQAEIYFMNGNYLEARQKFEKLQADHPTSPLADDALFFAGRAAMLTLTDEGEMRALALWQQLIESGSELALHARRHQAQVRLQQDDNEGAIALIDAVLEAAPAPELELEISCRLLKGRAQFKMGSKDSSMFAEAAKTFKEARKEGTPAESKVSAAARNESLHFEGLAEQAKGDTTAAIDRFLKVINAERQELGSDTPPEYLWYYRAGFECISLLQKRNSPGDIDSAITVANKLAKSRGPQAAQAENISELLHLENFRWR